jgi:hypothetical protein
MGSDAMLITLHHAKLIMGFTHQTLTEAEGDELDEWICEADENLEIFEELLNTVNNRRLSLDEIIVATEDIVDLWVIAGLMARQIQGVIEPDQKKQLKDWSSLSNQHKKLYKILRNPANLQSLILHVLQGSGEHLHFPQILPQRFPNHL